MIISYHIDSIIHTSSNPKSLHFAALITGLSAYSHEFCIKEKIYVVPQVSLQKLVRIGDKVHRKVDPLVL